MAAQLFMWLVAFVIAGFLWFWIVRPILEDWGVIGPGVRVATSEMARSTGASFAGGPIFGGAKNALRSKTTGISGTLSR
jgi:hypothetical protein